MLNKTIVGLTNTDTTKLYKIMVTLILKRYAILLMIFVVPALCEDKCAFGLYASGLNGLISLQYSKEQAELYLANDLGPLAAIAQASQQVIACKNEATKGSPKPGKKYPNENEQLPLYFDNIVIGRKAEFPNTIAASTGVDGHVNGRRTRITAQATLSLCLSRNNKICSHRTTIVCKNIASSFAQTGNLTASNLLQAGISCYPLYQEVLIGNRTIWTNVMPYDLSQNSLPTKNSSIVTKLPADFASRQLTGISSNALHLADPQAAATVEECTETPQVRHQLEANLGIPSVYISPWNGSTPSVLQVQLQTLAASCSYAPEQRHDECVMIKQLSYGFPLVKQTGRVCIDNRATARDFISSVPFLYVASAAGVATTELLPEQVATMEARGVLAYPPTSISELMLASLTCVLALVSSKKNDVMKVSKNISNMMSKKQTVIVLTSVNNRRQIIIAVFVYVAIAIAASASAVSIAISNVAGSRFLSYTSSGDSNSIPFTNGTIEVYLMYHVEYHYKPANYMASIIISSVIIVTSMGWAAYRCITFKISDKKSVLYATSYP